MPAKYYSDEELVAYLDGECSRDDRREIQAALKAQPDLQQRLDDMTVDFSTLPTAMSQLQTLTVPHLSHTEVEHSYSRRAIIGSIFAVGLTVGVVGGTLWPTTEPDWKDYVAAYHALYSPSTLADVDLAPSELAAQLSRVSAAINKQWEPGDLTLLQGVDYKRAQILNFEGKPLVQLSFLTSTGEPLALCVILAPGAGSSEPKLVKLEGMSAASWAKSGYEYLLIGGTSNDVIEQLASHYSNTQL